MNELKEINPEALLADGFEDAYIGWCEVFNRPPLAAYDRDKCIEILMERDGMDYEEAEEYFDFNVIDAYEGEYTPVFLKRYEGRV